MCYRCILITYFSVAYMAKLLDKRRIVHHFGNPTDGGVVEHCSMTSDVLGVDKEFSVYLPCGYDDSDIRYPVLYLFHPAGGTHEAWMSIGQLPQISDDSIRSGMACPMIIVSPDAGGTGDNHLGRHLGFFSVSGWDYERYFNEELIDLIDSIYRTIPDKHHRAITGVSMGGEAAIAYAQKHPDRYVAACSISGILGHPEQSVMAQTDKDYAASLVANDPTKFLEMSCTEVLEKLRTVKWYADCGDNDYFYEGNVGFYLAMKHHGIAIDYRMRSGVHSWYYWITGLPFILQFISVAFTSRLF